MQGLGALGCCDSCACLTPAKETCLLRGGLLCAANKYCGAFPAGGFGSFWALLRHLARERLLCMGLRSNPELSCRCSLEQSGPRLCCWPQQCAFVGVMGPGCSNLPWALDRGEWPACMCISGWACSTWPHPPRMHYGEPSALSASSLGCLADLQPDWLCLVAALAQLRWSVDTQEHRDARESSWGALWPAQSHTLLSALTLLADSVHPGKCGQVFPTSSWSSSQRFLNSSDARWRNNSSVKGKSPWGTELLGMWHTLL